MKKVDLARQIKAIESFEATAVKGAEETKGLVETELKDLEKTLENIQGARPFEDLTVVCAGLAATRQHGKLCMIDLLTTPQIQDEVMAAQPEIEKRVEKMVANHRWMPAGYKVCALLKQSTSQNRLLTTIAGEIRRLGRHLEWILCVSASYMLYRCRLMTMYID